MGKKRSRSSYNSKGERRNVSHATVKLCRETDGFTKEYNKILAWKQGKDPWITVPGHTTRERFIKVRATKLWGDPKKTRGIYTREEENA